MKNYLRCHCCVKNRLACEPSQNAHLQRVKSSATPTVFRLFLWGRRRYCTGCLGSGFLLRSTSCIHAVVAYVFQRPASLGQPARDFQYVQLQAGLFAELAIVAMIIFIVTLFVAYFYDLRRGGLDWD